LINITGGSDMTLFEVDEAANRIRSEVDEDAYIIFGSTFDDSLEGRMRVSVVATGIHADRALRPVPSVLSVNTVAVSAPAAAPAKPHPVSALQATVAQALAEKLETEKTGTQSDIPNDPVDEPVMQVEAQTDSEADAIDDHESHDVTDLTEAQEVEEVAEAPALETTSVTPPPAGMPGAFSTDAYIPPAPTARTGQDRTGKDAEHIDPMAEAALINGAETPAKPKGLSLFERVTGGAKNKVMTFGQARSEPQAPAPAETRAVSPQAPKPAMRSTGGVQQAMTEPTLGGLNPEERLQASPSEDDLLDIPAFLRRQAN
jgi:cell division protein FtsZ